MALRFFTGFDYASLPPHVTTNAGSFVAGRAGGYCKELGGGLNYARWFAGAVDTSTTVVGWAQKLVEYYALARVQLNGGDLIQFTVLPDSLGRPVLSRGSTVLGTGTTQLALNNWYYFEMKFNAHLSSGSFEFRINSITEDELTFSGVNLANSGSNGWDTIALYGGYVDDWYIEDGSDATATQGAPYNDFLGDVSCQAVMPDGNGAHSDFVGSDSNSTDNYLLVDEVPANSDTDYVASATVGAEDTYAMGAIAATTGTIYAVQPLIYARKDDAGARSIRTITRESGGTERESADFSIGETYTYYTEIVTRKPSGGVWTIADVNGAQVGLKVTV